MIVEAPSSVTMEFCFFLSNLFMLQIMVFIVHNGRKALGYRYPIHCSDGFLFLSRLNHHKQYVISKTKRGKDQITWRCTYNMKE